VVVLGAGFGGLELTTRLSDALGDEMEIVLIDRRDGFVFGFSKLDVMFGRSPAAHVVHPYRDLVKRGVRFVQTTIRSIDPERRTVETDAGSFDGDFLVIALGADVHPDATPGLTEGGHEFYTVEGAFAVRDVLADFDGGRVIVGVTSTPSKCPPAPSETALLVHDHLVRRRLRESSSIALVMPLGAPIPPSPAASSALPPAGAPRPRRPRTAGACAISSSAVTRWRASMSPSCPARLPSGTWRGRRPRWRRTRSTSGPIASAAGSAERGRPPKRPSPDR
jgi:sulfide:quinone oxidoreductase